MYKPAVPIGVIVKLADRAHQAVARVREQRKVKFAVDALPLAKVVTGERFHAAQTAAQCVDIAFGEARDVDADRQRLVNDPHGVQLLEVVDGERGHAPAAVHLGLDQAFPLQHAHGFAERPTADAELAGQLNLGQRFARGQRAVEDRFAEAAVAPSTSCRETCVCRRAALRPVPASVAWLWEEAEGGGAYRRRGAFRSRLPGV